MDKIFHRIRFLERRIKRFSGLLESIKHHRQKNGHLQDTLRHRNPELMYVQFAADYTPMWVSDSMRRVLRAENSDLIGQPFLNFLPHKDGDIVSKMMAFRRQTKLPSIAMYHLLLPTLHRGFERVLIRWKNSPIFDDLGNIIEFRYTGKIIDA